MIPTLKINNRDIGITEPTYIIAEMSANHNQNFNKAVKIIEAASKAGADAIKLQTYTQDTLTINCDRKEFKIKDTIWNGKNLYDLYKEASTPWKWHPKLKKVAETLGLDFFSTPFDFSSVDFLFKLDIPVFKIASFEIVDFPLLRKIAETQKPIIMSTGMASIAEIHDAVEIIRKTGNNKIALLKCTSAYPALPEDMNLKTIKHLSETFHVPTGLSDHTMEITVPIIAVTIGASIVEKHFTLSRSDPGPDNSFSLEPKEFKTMVDAIRITKKAIGEISYKITEKEKKSKVFRRSLFVVKDMESGEVFTYDNIRSIRPGYGIHTRNFENIIGRRAVQKIERGTPLQWNLVK